MAPNRPLQILNRDLSVPNPPQESPYTLIEENRPPSPPVDFGVYGWRYPGYRQMWQRIKLANAMLDNPRLTVRARVKESYCQIEVVKAEEVVVTARQASIGESRSTTATSENRAVVLKVNEELSSGHEAALVSTEKNRVA
jgi:hypothetical protein